jgi:urease accessory protein
VDGTRFKPEANRRATTNGAARIVFRRDGSRTRVSRLEQRHPLRVLFPDAPDDGVGLAVLANVSGGIVGGDRLEFAAELEPGASVMITTQAAEKVYRSTGATATIDSALSVGDQAWLEWLPHETILFDRARLLRNKRIDVAASGRLLAGEIVVFGRAEHGERLCQCHLRDQWEIRHCGRLIWCDALRLEGDIGGELAHPMRFGGARAYGTLIYMGTDAAAMLDLVRGQIDSCRESAATRIANLVIVRFLSASTSRLRQAYGGLWARLRARAAGLPAHLPRIWAI